MEYHYKTKLGIFRISPDPEIPGQYRLYMDQLWIGSYFSAEAAASDVYTQTTGYDPWDLQDEAVFDPRNLGQWQEGAPGL